MTTPDIFQGAQRTDGNALLINDWLSINKNGATWLSLPIGTSLQSDRGMVDKAMSRLLAACASTPAAAWKALCDGIGMTVYGAVALSWCKGADLSQVWEGWEASGFPIKPLPEYERPARFINPALIPATNSLMELARIVENKTLPICAMIVAKGDALDVDLTPGQAAKASPQIASFLKAHMEQKQSRTDEQNQMIETWADLVSGTEWEI